MQICDHFNPDHRRRIELLLDLIRPRDNQEASVLPDEYPAGENGGGVGFYYLNPDPSAWPRLFTYDRGEPVRVYPAIGARLALGYRGRPRDPDRLFFVLILRNGRYIFLSRSMVLIEVARAFLRGKSRRN